MIGQSDIADAVAHYRAAGYAVLRGVFTDREIAAIGTAFDRHWAHGIALGASFRHGNLLYRLGEDPALGTLLRMVQRASAPMPASSP